MILSKIDLLAKALSIEPLSAASVSSNYHSSVAIPGLLGSSKPDLTNFPISVSSVEWNSKILCDMFLGIEGTNLVIDIDQE